jgi:hypothetical protein
VDVGVGILLISPLTVIENRPFRVPFDNDRWLVSAVNLDARALPAGALQAYAICTQSIPSP